MGTVIGVCDPCKPGSAAAYQDEVHGPGKRVMNIGLTKAKCTVCGREITTGRTEKPPVEGEEASKKKPVTVPDSKKGDKGRRRDKEQSRPRGGRR